MTMAVMGRPSGRVGAVSRAVVVAILGEHALCLCV